LKPMLEAFRQRNALVVERVRRIPGFSLPNVPQGAFYVFPNVSGLLGRTFNGKKIEDGDQLAAYLLDEAHVSLVGGNDFGAPEHVRISYATSVENLNKAFDRIEQAVAKLR
jgi:aspartate aminotransferase